MAGKKALLIASPFRGLQGPTNDVDKMDKALQGIGFETSQCSGSDATRAGILRAWQQLIDDICLNDAVVVYYSGHGGLVASAEPTDRSFKVPDLPTPWRYQFLVPMDFGDFDDADSDKEGDEEGETSFRGILDLELSTLVRATTARTPNLTLILDCCYAGRMARDPTAATMVAPRTISTTTTGSGGSSKRFATVARYADRLQRLGHLHPDLHVDQDPCTVRVAAAAAGETAWEYCSEAEGAWHGALTEALVCVLGGGGGGGGSDGGVGVSWRTILLRVAELVNVRFPYQHPEVAGPADRVLFQVREVTEGAFNIRSEGGDAGLAVIQAGRVLGVREGNVYTVIPFGVDRAAAVAAGTVEMMLGEARVISATAFKATVEFVPRDPARGVQLPTEGALAFLRYDALYRWPVALPPGCKWLANMVQTSRFIRARSPDDDGDLVLAEFREGPDAITLHNNRGREIASASTTNASLGQRDRLFESAEQLARGQHLLSLSNEALDDVLQHGVDVKFGLVDAGRYRGRTIQQDGTDSICEGDRVYIELVNRGPETIYMWIFDVNVAGRIKLVSKSSPRGVELPPGRMEVLGAARHRHGLRGLSVGWPEALSQSKGDPVEETLMLILTSSPVDLYHLSDRSKLSTDRTNLSVLEQLTSRISSGESRNVTVVEDDDNVVRYTTIRIPFLLFPKTSPTEGPV
jgi:hypothetical protein